MFYNVSQINLVGLIKKQNKMGKPEIRLKYLREQDKPYRTETNEKINYTPDYVEWLEHQLSLCGVVVSLPKFKVGQTLKRKSNYSNDFIEIKVKFINKLKTSYRYLSENGVWYDEKELLAH